GRLELGQGHFDTPGADEAINNLVEAEVFQLVDTPGWTNNYFTLTTAGIELAHTLANCTDDEVCRVILDRIPPKHTHRADDPFGEAIDTHSRARAVADGLLVEVCQEIAHEAGFTVAVALTAAAWGDCVAWSDADNQRTGACQDEQGRLWDVLWMTQHAI